MTPITPPQSTVVVRSGADPSLTLSAETACTIYRQMARTRMLEIRTIQMSKSGEGFFWVGGPGEEAFNVCLGLQVRKGCGPAFDFLHLHYRSSGVLLSMGMPMMDHFRQMAMRATDPHSLGRNFVGHYSIRAWNVVPISSVISVQYAMAAGSAMVQKRYGGEGITIVTGGEAGTASGDFQSCMLWSSRPGQEVPTLIIVTNNGYGISTPAESQIGADRLVDRAASFGISGESIDGNDPIASWHAIARGMKVCRTQRRPYFIEAKVGRLYGHSSSSGGQRVAGELDCLLQFEQSLINSGAATADILEQIRHEAEEEVRAAADVAVHEPAPTPEDVYRHTFAPSSVDAIYPTDYTGLPGGSEAR
ncbi:thiamine pyrophosphate-dependent dehydrogenase E1 component subunit alpha [Tuwongella immobilis]|uniref:2-oxoisovalerate dehydrogenase subunit alpha n=1 Tax=Tuwongella immobilis TaxID=692036 RepID=A0A6C2YLK6_9BACT|nr:thiamine pyrophosphate-dependent dehydrogenase E1 component subunit alpha [Tuwongella immobilis]VIP02119.1 3-methyl-2-oxobutanoate dehydrogenase : Uncultured bacterium genome assembly Metasoil_fosmids_resub OS=uncultured bacterium PE=4 SV=1: E1_dh [Tuwongella immobilis]VTS00443.1 3-methyl-2-oxobutanoate dehydrogenase : Uncultured bacterium genome assembly Metasoil_fosmids_resub OS=uncultured bacterium PE=4 SV=1: E1_dh [Tuwongella immobilis]